MNFVEWIESLLVIENEFVLSIAIGILFLLIYDFYHLLFSAVLSWFKKS